MTATLERDAQAGEGLNGLIASGGLRSVFQPIVCLDRLAPVGVEALLRGPAGSPWETPDVLFGAARAEGKVALLDWASRRTALEHVLEAGLTGPASLFLNAEPEGIRAASFPGFDAVADAVSSAGVQVVLEITERALTQHPAELLHTVQAARDLGWRLAIDDVGADRASLALMPFLAPDIIKLDLRLVQARTTVEIAEIVNAVLAHAERTGAVILAEGIETERHLDLARSMGARLGQGWYFGRPGELHSSDPFVPLVLQTERHAPTPSSPWEVVKDLPAVRTASKSLLVALSKTLENRALADSEACVVQSAFQRGDFFTPDTARRYEQLARRAALVTALGEDMPDAPAVGVRGCALGPDDRLLEEWDVVVVGPHFATALVAREHPGQRPGQERQFDYLVTYDRERVLAVARSLMLRLDAQLG